MAEIPKEDKASVAEENKEKKPLAPRDFDPWEVHKHWTTANAKIFRLEIELAEARRIRDQLESKHPFLGQIKGILRREAKRPEEEETVVEEAPKKRKVEESPSKPKQTSAQTPKKTKDVRGRLEDKLKEQKERNLPRKTDVEPFLENAKRSSMELEK